MQTFTDNLWPCLNGFGLFMCDKVGGEGFAIDSTGKLVFCWLVTLPAFLMLTGHSMGLHLAVGRFKM